MGLFSDIQITKLQFNFLIKFTINVQANIFLAKSLVIICSKNKIQYYYGMLFCCIVTWLFLAKRGYLSCRFRSDHVVR